MTRAQAIKYVELALLELAIVDAGDGGEQLKAPQVAGILGAHFGRPWTDLEDALERDDISGGEYCDGICDLIDQYRKRLFHQRVAKRIESLVERQGAEQ